MEREERLAYSLHETLLIVTDVQSRNDKEFLEGAAVKARDRSLADFCSARENGSSWRANAKGTLLTGIPQGSYPRTTSRRWWFMRVDVTECPQRHMSEVTLDTIIHHCYTGLRFSICWKPTKKRNSISYDVHIDYKAVIRNLKFSLQ